MRSVRKTNASLLAFLYYQWCCITWSMQILDGKLRSEEYLSQQVKILQNYEIVTPAIFNSGELNGGDDSSTVIQIGAFGKTYDIVLQKRHTHSTVNTLVEYIGKNKTYEAKYLSEDECFYSGDVKTYSNDTLNVVLNFCDGVEGMIDTNDSLIFIEPLRSRNAKKRNINQQHIVYKGEDVQLRIDKDTTRDNFINTRPNSVLRRHRRGADHLDSYLVFINKSGRTVNLKYLDEFSAVKHFYTFLDGEEKSINTFTGTMWMVKDERTKHDFLLDGKTEFIAPRNVGGLRKKVTITKPRNFQEIRKVLDNGRFINRNRGDQYFINVMVVADRSVINFHGKERVEKYILTMLDIAARVFEHDSLNVPIKLDLVKIHLVDDDKSGFEVKEKNARATLQSACNYISTLRHPDNHDSNNFDFGIALSRKSFGPSGFAELFQLCNERKSCVLVQDEGLTSAFMVAHETGHLLGIEHDGEEGARECDSEGYSGSIMSAVIKATYLKYKWSKCSARQLKENIGFFDCVKDRPRRNVDSSLIGHGSHYTPTEQCHFNFDKDYDLCYSYSSNICKQLFCTVPNSFSNKCRTKGPALQGTLCAENKYCYNGECTAHDDKLLPPYEEEIINGKWGSWTPWSTCSQSCSVGIRSRARSCDNPRNNRRGIPCHGKSDEKEVCNTKICAPESPLDKHEMYCQMMNGKDWTKYIDGFFDRKLHHPRYDPNCTFEFGFCNWLNDGKNDMNWEIHHGETQSFNTGPSFDNTRRSVEGKYLYVEASKKDKDDIAKLSSKFLNVPRVCFTMFYHMFGDDIGRLTVKIRFRNDSEIKLWSKKGNKGNEWRKAEILIESVDPYKIVVEAKRGNGWASDIAIDDLSAVTGFCSSERSPSDRCKVSCRTADARQFKMRINVTDGARCGVWRSSDICLGGECVAFGCDNKFGSKLLFDYCGVCGGDNSSCDEVSDVKNMYLHGGFQIVLTIEKGSTFIDIREKSSKNHYAFGVKEKNSEVKKMVKKAEGFVVLANSIFKFQKIDGKQHITSEGKLSESVELIVYNYRRFRTNSLLRLRYHYFKPYSIDFSYSYESIGWEECSSSCGTGKQRSLVSCIRFHDKMTVDDSFCARLEKPVYIRSCHIKPCPQKYRWRKTDWRECSKSCGRGERVRKVLCIQMERNRIVSDSLCPLPQPSRIGDCNIHDCPDWDTTEWGYCSQTCGIGIKERQVKCIDQTTGNPVNDSECTLINKPYSKSPCNIHPCENFVYEISPRTGNCSKTCGGGFKPQIVNCVKISTREYVHKKYCDGPSPPIILPCNTHHCPEFDWRITSAPCSHTCGWGSILREVSCVNLQSNKKMEDSFCTAIKPPSTVPCNRGKCPFDWVRLNLTSCSQTCGSGRIIYTVSCINITSKAKVDDSDCHGDKPAEYDSCFIRKCQTYEVQYSPWGKCSSACGTGVQERTFTCLDGITRLEVPKKMCLNEITVLKRRCTKECQQEESLFCDFDHRTLCNWQNTHDDDFDWLITNNVSPLLTGLKYDTMRRGYFAYTGTSPRRKGKNAVLYSPFVSIPRGCLSFKYYMSGGKNMGRLRVYLSTANTTKLLFEKHGPQGEDWLSANIPVQSSDPYRITFDATRGIGVDSGAAIDDISFVARDCASTKKRYGSFKIPHECIEKSSQCKLPQIKRYCRLSPRFRSMCCNTCPGLLISLH